MPSVIQRPGWNRSHRRGPSDWVVGTSNASLLGRRPRVIASDNSITFPVPWAWSPTAARDVKVVLRNGEIASRRGPQKFRLPALPPTSGIRLAVRQLLIQREALASCRLAQHARPVLTMPIPLTQRRPLPLLSTELGPGAEVPECNCRPSVTIPSPGDRPRQCQTQPGSGRAPTASRMANSRVRQLTENASTPAIPTAEITNARVANPPNTTAFTRLFSSTSVRTSSRVLAWSTG